MKILYLKQGCPLLVSAPGPDLPGKDPGHDRTWLGPDKIKDKDFPN